MVVVNIDKLNAFEEAINSGSLVVVHFYADWAAQCGPMDAVLDELSRQVELRSVKFARCPAEEVPEVSAKYAVAAVPTFLLLHSGRLLDRVNGANAAELTKKINQQLANPLHSLNGPRPPVSAPEAEDLPTRLKRLVSSAPVMLFMKGSADEPRCGFSKTIIEILNNINGDYKTFDILSDEEVRQGLKTFSDWPTYPQLYVKGELIGGLDIVKELKDSGELEALIPKKQTLEERLKSLTNKSPCMVFMKGDRKAPRCGFSRQLMEILGETGVQFETFDILDDEEVRQGLKTFSNWPTYPQVYARGELIGGLDIVKEMLSSGELVETLKGGS